MPISTVYNFEGHTFDNCDLFFDSLIQIIVASADNLCCIKVAAAKIFKSVQRRSQVHWFDICQAQEGRFVLLYQPITKHWWWFWIDRRSRGKDRRSRGKDRRSRGKDRRSRGKDRRSRGKDRRPRGKDRRSRGKDRRSRGKDRRSRGKDQGKKIWKLK